MKQELAIMKNVFIGCRDINKARLWFTVDMLEDSAGLSLSIDEAVAMIESNRIQDIRKLEGRACIVESDGTTCRFVGLRK